MPQTFKVHYRGGFGPKLALATSPNSLIVRTQSAAPLDDTPLPAEARRALQPFRPSVFFRKAGVTILEPVTSRVSRAERDRARRVLKTVKEIRFAGRVLIDGAAHAPVSYTENFFVQFAEDVKPSKCRSMLRSHGLEVRREIEYLKNAYFASAPEGTGTAVFAMAEKLLDEDDVDLCHPEIVRERVKRGAYPQQWHLKRATFGSVVVDAHAFVEDAWALSRGDNVKIAIIDDGVDVDHLEFKSAGKVVAPRDESWDTSNPRPKSSDEMHGTACAGVACADGVAGASGVAPGARLIPVRLASDLGSQDEADAFHWAASNGADVISCSWGPSDGDWWDPNDPLHSHVVHLPDSTRMAIDWAVANGRGGKGTVVCWAAGNGNEPVENDGYASYGNVIAVAACNDTGKRSVYSDFGAPIFCAFPSSDFEGFDNPKPKTTGIWTTDRSAGQGYNPGNVARGDAAGHFTNSFGGTSSASPGAAGVAALVMSVKPALKWHEVRDILRQSCDRIDVAGGGYDASGRSKKYGFGRLNARRAVELAMGGAPAPAPTMVSATAQGPKPIRDFQETKLSVAVTDARPIRGSRVAVKLTHTWVGDLVIWLVPPASLAMQPVVLRSRVGGKSTGLDVVFDAANAPGLGGLVGRSAKGQWTLSVYDAAASDAGMLTSFRLEFDV